jgi:hypothetical protein
MYMYICTYVHMYICTCTYVHMYMHDDSVTRQSEMYMHACEAVDLKKQTKAHSKIFWSKFNDSFFKFKWKWFWYNCSYLPLPLTYLISSQTCTYILILIGIPYFTNASKLAQHGAVLPDVYFQTKNLNSG